MYDQVQFLEKIDAAIGDIVSRLNKDELENGESQVSWQVLSYSKRYLTCPFSIRSLLQAIILLLYYMAIIALNLYHFVSAG